MKAVIMDAGCAYTSPTTENCVNNVNDPIKALKEALDLTASGLTGTLTTATTTATTGYDAKKAGYNTAKLAELK
jgi:hypothetical protein